MNFNLTFKRVFVQLSPRKMLEEDSRELVFLTTIVAVTSFIGSSIVSICIVILVISFSIGLAFPKQIQTVNAEV